MATTTVSSAARLAKTALINRRLYRSLLRAAQPFTRGKKAAIYNCLIHRTQFSFDDDTYEEYVRNSRDDDEAKELFGSNDEYFFHRLLFTKLLRELISGGDPSGIRQMSFPCHNEQPSLLRDIIRREFKNDEANPAVSQKYDDEIRQQVAFSALREINKKWALVEQLEKRARPPHPQQAAPGVSRLPFLPPSSYLRPGAYLLSHPNMKGIFRRSVICILEHKDEMMAMTPYSTYGLIVNKLCVSPKTNRSLTLQEVLRPIPTELGNAFAGASVREGGPVHMSLQILQASTPEQEELKIGGHVLPMIPASDEATTAAKTDRAIYYGGDVLNAANAINSGKLDREDVSFFVGACTWDFGQLEREMEQGCWLPCRGPPEIAQLGICDHEQPTEKGMARPKADLWLSMMSACGEGEAALAHLVLDDDTTDEEFTQACDYPLL